MDYLSWGLKMKGYVPYNATNGTIAVKRSKSILGAGQRSRAAHQREMDAGEALGWKVDSRDWSSTFNPCKPSEIWGHFFL